MDLSSERVVHIPQPQQHYTLACATSGEYLYLSEGQSAEEPAQLSWSESVDDRAIWRDEGAAGLLHVISGIRLALQDAGDGTRTLAKDLPAGVCLGEGVAPGSVIEAAHGPAELPSASLAHLREHGWVCLPAILSPQTIDALERVACTDRYSAARFDGDTLPLVQDRAIAEATTEPVSLWLIRQYLRADDIHLGHPPGLAVLAPDDGERDVQGWHSDFPYLWGFMAEIGGGQVPAGFPAELALAVQRNICISKFTKPNGATCFKLGTHVRNEGPPEAWGLGRDYARKGFRKENGLPYNGADADTIEAPGGSMIVYDARTWHRAGVNRTDNKRAAMLQAVTPRYIMPFIDCSAAYKAFVNAPVYQELNALQRRVMARLMVHKIVGPMGAHAITLDREAVSS